MARRSVLRASDSDRENIAERLRHATGEGRLKAAELEERLERAFTARTYGELDSLVADLPAVSDRRRRPPLWVQGAIAVAVVLAVVAVLALVALILIGLASLWFVWLMLAWVFFGRGRQARYIGCSRTRSTPRGAVGGPWL
jgi:hypothetical protein